MKVRGARGAGRGDGGGVWGGGRLCVHEIRDEAKTTEMSSIMGGCFECIH